MKILAFALSVAALVLPAGCATPPPRPAAERADALLRDLADRGLFQGAAIIGRDGVVEYAEGFGFADVERRVPFSPDTPTDGASIAKTFTAAALLLLASEGRIDLEARVSDVLPTFPHSATRVRHLLAHSAGLPSYEWLDSRATPGEPRTNASHLALVARDAPAPSFPPGTSFEYDNVAYDVAAMVVERVTGSSYAEIVTERFARPLGLATFVRPARFADWPGTRTRGYRRTAAGFADHDAYDLEGFYGADNIYLSARDLYRWVAGYRGLLGATMSRVAVDSTALDDGRTTGISQGSWYVSADGNRRYYTGHHNGFFNFGYADDGRHLAVAWVANDAPPPWLQPALSRALIAMAEGRDPESLVPPSAADTTVDPSGVYQVPEVGETTVRREGDRLVVRLRGVDYDAFPVAPGVRYVPGLDGYLRFARAPDGQVTLSWDSVFVVAASVARDAPIDR